MEDIVMSAAASLLGAMATDAWGRARDGVIALWRRARTGPAGQEAELDTQLAALRTRLTEARQTGDTAAEQAMAADWQERFRELLRRHPELAEPIRDLIDELGPAPAAPPDGGGTTLTARVSGQGRAYLAGRDITVHER
ncbi:hypothetical protein [Streptomyces sp. NPDC057686]|uniref:hypothetical protein n=1 Tax=Streptomyces sp. NPDC057686 TaxID=3346212 RepID=UPI0036C21819